MANTQPIHVFERPPVVETVLGVQFDPLKGFTNAHLGAFWKSLDGEWPNISDSPTLDDTFERFGDEQAWQELGPKLRFTHDAGTRLQIRNAQRNRMIQVQNGRLHYNWLRRDDERYPQYSKVRPEFDAVYSKFLDFVAAEKLGELSLNQWEVTYVNLIEKGTVWNGPSDWDCVFASSPIAASPDSVELESINHTWHFVIPPYRGRLHAHLVHGRRKENDGEELLRLTLTARGPIARQSEQGLSWEEGLDLGRMTIVETFKNMTSTKAHEYWGLVNEHS